MFLRDGTLFAQPFEARRLELVEILSRNVPEPSRIRPAGRHDDSRRAVVIIEESTKTLATANPTHALRRRRPVDEFVPEPLVIALAMIVLHELGEGSS